MSEPTTTEADVPDVQAAINIELYQRAEGSITMRPVGLRPYILLEVKDVTDDELTISIEVGGGVPADPVADLSMFLGSIAEALEDYTVADDEDEVTE